ncbi:MAG: pyridoxamine 5'-phosphate oxidase family protein [Acidobacteria bacterium]|nr:pyridoxamine 5'-phosphate oxidase family protein [Acidobacteriota bacterium]
MQANWRRITTTEELAELYGEPMELSLRKELPALSAGYRAFIEKAPFAVIATSGPEGLDCSPRGDPPGFVRVADEKTLLLPDRRGNNRLDALRNIVRDPRISLLFLIPGVGETLRVNGRAEIVADAELCASFEEQGKAPRSVIVVRIESVYYQCPKALMRSKLWNPEARIDRDELPSAGTLLREACDAEFDQAAYDAAYPQRIKDTIY